VAKFDHAKGPDLRVIDMAIQRIEARRSHYSCFAIRDALRVLHGDPAAEVYWTPLYRRQFTRFCWAHLPRLRTNRWWNDCRGAHVDDRTYALKAFKQACIAAGEEKQHG
jgi:hypothetical protein